MNQFCSEGYMSPVWSSMDAGPVISLSMFCPHMVLLANTVVPVRQELTLHVYKQNRGQDAEWWTEIKQKTVSVS